MADFLICPRCRRQNAADAIFCNRCGVRLLSAGVSYRNRGSSSAVGMSQIVLGLGVLILAGLVLGGGAVVLLGGQRPTPSRISGLPSTSPSGLPTFVQPTATAAPSPTFVLPTLIPTVPPSVVPATAPTSTPGPTNPPQPTPEATPVDCAVAATGAESSWKSAVIGYGSGNKATRGPIGKTWCIHRVVIRPIAGYGTTTLLRNDKKIVDWSCMPGVCTESSFPDYSPPYRVKEGLTLRYEFECYDDPATVDVNECQDGIVDGATVEILYEAIDGPP